MSKRSGSRAPASAAPPQPAAELAPIDDLDVLSSDDEDAPVDVDGDDVQDSEGDFDESEAEEDELIDDGEEEERGSSEDGDIDEGSDGGVDEQGGDSDNEQPGDDPIDDIRRAVAEYTRETAARKTRHAAAAANGTSPPDDGEAAVPQAEVGAAGQEEEARPVDPGSDSSEDERPNRNTVGEVPLIWYKDEDHIGYDLEGKKVVKGTKRDELEKLLRRNDSKSAQRTIYDDYNGEEIVLSKEELSMVMRIRKGHFPHLEVNPYEPYDDYFTRDVEVMPINAAPEPKRRFIPSKWEEKKIVKLVRAIRKGWLKTAEQKEKPEAPPVYMLWADDDTGNGKTASGLTYIPAAKPKLPTHNESYNPSAEYLPTQEERDTWEMSHPEDRPPGVLATGYPSLRLVPAYGKFIQESFERCLDLYLCPRVRRKRMHIDPETLVPQLPKPRDLAPYPTTLAMRYTGHSGRVRAIAPDPCGGQWLLSGGDDGTLRLWEVRSGRCVRHWALGGPITSVAWCPAPGLRLVSAVTGSRAILLPCGVAHPDVEAAALEALKVQLRIGGVKRPCGRPTPAAPTAPVTPPSDPPPHTHKPSAPSCVVVRIPSIAAPEEGAPPPTYTNPPPFRVALQIPSIAVPEEGAPPPPVTWVSRPDGGVELQHRHQLSSIAWHGRGDYFSTVAPNGNTQAVMVHQLSKCATQNPFRKNRGKVIQTAFHPTKPFFFVATQNHVRVYNLAKQELAKKLLGSSGPITCLAVHSSGDHVLVGGEDKRLAWYDMDLSTKPYKALRWFRKEDVRSIMLVGGTLTGTQHPAYVQLGGYQLLTDLVRSRWSELDKESRQGMSSFGMTQLAQVHTMGPPEAAWSLRSKVAEMLVAVVRQQGGQELPALLSHLLLAAPTHTSQAEVVCRVLQFISEDLTQFDTPGANDKRAFLAAVTTAAASVFPFLCQMLETHFQAAMAATSAPPPPPATSGPNSTPPSTAAAHASVVSSALEFRLDALDVLKQIASRRRSSEKVVEDIASVMEKLGTALLASSQRMGLLPAMGESLPAAMSAQLDHEGELEEFGKRLSTTLAVFGELHFRSLGAGSQLQTMFLQQMLVFSRHPHLLLSVTTLPLWSALLREAIPVDRTVNANGSIVATAAAAPAGEHEASAAATAAAAAAAVAAAQRAATLVSLPEEACSVLIITMAEQLQRVVLQDTVIRPPPPTSGPSPSSPTTQRPASPPHEHTVPDFMESFAEWKEFAATYRGSAKLIIRGAMQLAPTPGAVHLLTASLPSLVEALPTHPALSEGISGMLSALLGAALREPVLMMLQAEAYEAFGKYLSVRPDLAVPLVRACLEHMALLPLDEPGSSPPPTHASPAWKKGFEARLCMATAVVTLAKAAPAAFAPHLQSLVADIQRLYDAGALREGEKVLLWEGLLMASRVAGLLVQSQMVEWVFSPMHDAWLSPNFLTTLSSPQMLLSTFLPLERETAGPNVAAADAGALVIGARGPRWILHHQLTLLERAMRRTAQPHPPPAQQPHIFQAQDAAAAAATAAAAAHAGGGSSGGGSSQEPPASAAAAAGSGAAAAQIVVPVMPPHPFNAHLDWCLPPVAAMIRSLQGLHAPQILSQLGPLSLLVEMDPVERAVRAGEDRDAAREASSRASRSCSGASLEDGRYFVRGLRDSCMMVLSLAGCHCSAMWRSASLAALLLPAMLESVAWVDLGQMRLMLRHVFTPWVLHCPAELQPQWMGPICSVLLPHLAQRLSSGWESLLAGPLGATSLRPLQQQLTPVGSKKESQAAAASQEVVVESLLREVTQETAALLVALTRRHASPPAAPAPGTQRTSASGGGTTAGPCLPDLLPHPGAGDSVMELLLRSHPEAMQAAASIAVATLCWPDGDSAAKAALCCRRVTPAGLAAASAAPSLEEIYTREASHAPVKHPGNITHFETPRSAAVRVEQHPLRWLRGGQNYG
ncbi:MAG: hypothetical protein WDW38_010263 [Sanguina aurantia]